MAVLVLLLTTAVVGLPLFAGRVLSGQDIVTYLINAQQMAANLRAGEVFPAWGGGFNAGYGSPTLIFYPPLTSYLNAIGVLVGVPVMTGVCALALFAHFASGAALYGWLRSTGVGRSALAAAVVYMVAPYRFIDLFLRSALSEHWAFVWPPLILWVAGRRSLHPFSRVPLIAILVSALLLTNTPMAVLFGLALAVWFVISRHVADQRFQVAIGAGLGFTVSSFALVPQALASSLLNTDIYYGAAAQNFRPSANTLFSGGFAVWNLNTVFSLVLVSTFAIAVLAFVLLTRAQRRDPGAAAALLAAIFCVLVATTPAGPIWDALPVISNLQFPWRVTSVITLISSSLVARLTVRRAWIVVAVAVMVSVPFSGWNRTVPLALFSPQIPPPSAPGSVFPDPHAAWEAGSAGWYWRHHGLVEPWLLPRNVEPFFLEDLGGRHAPQLDRIRHRPAVLLEDPSARLRVIEWGQIDRRLEIESPVGGTMLWRIISFPDMRVWVDGEEVEVSNDPTTGLLVHRVPRGRHFVHWAWEPFRALIWGRAVSVAALLLTIGLGCAGLCSRAKRKGANRGS
jgi:hypothetical protein